MPTSRPNLPSEIIEAILVCLHAKSLGHFKSVSKTWDSLISHPRFIKMHLHRINERSHQPTKLILISLSDSDYSLYSIDMNELFTYLNNNNNDEIPATVKRLSLSSNSIEWEEIMGSCNRLVLGFGVIGSLYLMNPTTRELWDVPFSPFADLTDVDENYYDIYGFGYVTSTDDYKVVCISQNDIDDIMYLTVYNLNNNSWRKLPDTPYSHCVLKSGVLFNERLHWIASKRSQDSTTIFAFSLENEEFHEIELPSSFKNNKPILVELVTVDGKLGISSHGLRNDLWLMTQYGVGKSWFKISIHGCVKSRA